MLNLVQIAQLIGSVGLIGAAAAGWATFILYHRKSLESQWAEGFRQIYTDFWKDEKVSKARRWIDNDFEYEELKRVLNLVPERGSFNMRPEDYDYIERLDRFLATILRVLSFIQRRKNSMREEQRWLWANMFEGYWVAKMKSRPELVRYVEQNWRGLHSLWDTSARAR